MPSVGKPRIFRHLGPLATASGEKVALAPTRPAYCSKQYKRNSWVQAVLVSMVHLESVAPTVP